ncbi:MAG: helix-turn-helix domain-containing protein [Deltaproteobacteria bacterium]|nr:helix-turn-helix domain-containing protein [Deltaproteobacteria bacterium]
MKNLDGLTYYEILKIPANSSSFEIKRAYKDALSTYNEDSLVTYSLFSNEERDEILKTIKEAFLTLIDKNKRTAYDTILVDSGQIKVSITSIENQEKPPRAHTYNVTDNDDSAERVKKKLRKKELETLCNEIFSNDLISGDDLKEMRKTAGIELSEINAVTKISVSVLKSMEENRIESLPPGLYLKNFLRLYAETLQIDPQKVIDGYLKHISLTQKK